MDPISVPILLALSAISIIALLAISADLFVSPAHALKREALNEVTFSIYSLADKPVVLYA